MSSTAGDPLMSAILTSVAAGHAHRITAQQPAHAGCCLETAGGIDRFGTRPAISVVKDAACDLGVDLEYTMLVVVKRKVPQGAFDDEPGVLRVALDDGLSQPFARMGADAGRQIAMDGSGIGTNQCSADV